MLTFRFSGGYGEMTVPETLTTGMVGKQVLLEFTPDWDGLVKTVVFSNGTATLDVLYTGGPVAIPAAILEKPLKTLSVGIYGVSADGSLVIPTVRAVGPKILPGTEPTGDTTTDPELPVWAQLHAMIGNLEDLETQAKESLVAAVNELALEIPESGATFTPAVDENGMLSWTNDKGLANPEPVNVKGPRGIMGPQGEKGDRGDTGPMGPQGLRGEKGDTGLPGAKGDRGDTGPMGPQGLRGAKGDTGPAGADGKDARIVAQADAPEDTAVLWVDTDDNTNSDAVFTNPLLGKSISFNGDSICRGYDGAGGYGKIIADRNAMTYQNIAVGGATITAETYSDSTGNALHWISRTISDMDETADYAIVEGGVNDGYYVQNMGSLSDGFAATLDDTTFYGAFESMLKQLILRFPGKKIGYIAVHKFDSNFDSRVSGGYYEAAKSCCEKWGVPFCDLNTTVPPFGYLSGLKNVYTSDGAHPNEAGYKKFYCDKIEAWLKTL